MIITRTPFRISFFGGGTDYPVYFREYGGSVLNATINHYCYIMCRYLPSFFDYKYRIRYTKIEYTGSADEIQHPSVRACLQFMDIKEGIEMVHSSDIPAMSGIGSSSAFTVGFLHSLYALKGKMIAKRALAADAILVEQDVLKENVGSQDQVATAFGGLNRIEFYPNATFFVQPVTLGHERMQQFQDHLLFCFTGFQRCADDIARKQIREAKKKISELEEMRAMVDEALNVLNGGGDLDPFGVLLDKTWKIKRSLTDAISSRKLDEIYDRAIDAGALGGKLCGAGGGGFFLFFVPPERHQRVKDALRKLLWVPFGFENTGSHVAFYSENRPDVSDYDWTPVNNGCNG